MELKELAEGLQKTWSDFQIEHKKLLDTNRSEFKGNIEKVEKRFDDLEAKMNRKGAGSFETADADVAASKAAKAAYGKLLRRGKEELSPEEKKALTVSDDTQAGYFAPVEYANEIIKGIVEFSPVRSVARVMTISRTSVQIPKRTTPLAAAWAAEVGTKSEDTAYRAGLEEIAAEELYARKDISNWLLEDSAFNLEAEMAMEFSEQIGVAEGTAFISGSGVSRPEGILTNADVSYTATGTTSTISADGLVALVYDIKDGYARNATFALRRASLKVIRQKKDSQGQYLWAPGLAGGQPNTILDYPYIECLDMPVEGAGHFPVLFGDFRRAYTIVDRVDMNILRDPFTLAATGQVRFIGRKRVGGQVVLAEAIRKLKCAAS